MKNSNPQGMSSAVARMPSSPDGADSKPAALSTPVSSKKRGLTNDDEQGGSAHADGMSSPSFTYVTQGHMATPKGSATKRRRTSSQSLPPLMNPW